MNKVKYYISRTTDYTEINRTKLYEEYVKVSGDILTNREFFKTLRRMGFREKHKRDCDVFINIKLSEIPNNIEDKSGVVYFITDGEYVKIGSTNNLYSRFASLQTSNPRKLTILKTIECIDRFETERNVHNIFEKYRINGEWFNILHILMQIFLP